jgi:hypothetical protein
MNAPARLTWMKFMYAANVVGAGVPGFLVTFFPESAETYLFGAVAQDSLLFGVTGSIWFAIGLISAFGLRYPLPLAAIFLVQIVYKAVWIAAVGIPLSLQGDPRALPFVIFFALVAAGFAYAVPFRYLFGPQGRVSAG